MKQPGTVGTVTLVGAGPGDPELLTLKAVRALAAAEVVLVDELVNPAVLAHCAESARIIHVGKRGGCRSTPQAVIDRLMLREARAGHRVVRLKGGDPFVFGRGGEELARLQAAGIPVAVVNGISAGLAAPAAAGIPVTHRELAQGAIFVTGHPRADGSEPDWASLARTGLTIVIYMGMRRLAEISAALREAGSADRTPVAIIENASLPAQRVLISSLAAVANEARRQGYGSPAIIVIGEVAALADAWPLDGTSADLGSASADATAPGLQISSSS